MKTVKSESSSKGALAYYLRNENANNFNLLRLVAAIAVIFAHSFALSLSTSIEREPINRFLPFTHSGSIAVDVFFLISGIFVSQSLFYERNYVKFIIKRFARIWPGLCVCLAISTIIAIALSPGFRPDIIKNPDTYLYTFRNSVFDLQNDIPNVFQDRKITAVNGSLWTLPLEAKMYLMVLLFGILGVLYNRVCLLAVALFLSIFIAFFYDKIPLSILVHDNLNLVPIVFFLCGMATFSLRGIIAIRWYHLLFVLIISAIASGLMFQILCYSFIGMLSLWFGCSEIIAKLPKLPGDYSYGIYLYGFPIQQGVATIWPDSGSYQMFFLSTCIALPFAIASWHLVEFPAQVGGKTLITLLSSQRRGAEGRLFSGFSASESLRRWASLAGPAIIVIGAYFGAKSADARLDSIAPAPLDATIIAFGPTPVPHGRPFNEQLDGKSAIWVKLEKPASKGYILVLGGAKLETVVVGDILTASVPSRLFAAPASCPLFVEVIKTGQRFRSGAVTFQVL